MNKIYGLCMIIGINFGVFGCEMSPGGANMWGLVHHMHSCLHTNLQSVSSSLEILQTSLSTSIDAILQGELATCCNTLSTLDTIIKSDVDSVSSSVTVVSNRLDTYYTSLRDTLTSTHDLVVEIEESLDVLTASNLDTVTSLLGVLIVDLQSANSLTMNVLSDVNIVASTMDSIIDMISTIESGHAQIQVGINSVGDALDSTIESCCSTLSTLDLVLKSDVDSVSTKVDSVGSLVSATKSSVDSVSSKLDACCSNLSVLDVTIKSDIDSVSTKIDSVGSQVSQVKSSIDSTSTKADSIGTQVSIVKSDVDSVSSKLDTCCSALSVLDVIIKSDVDSVSTKIDSVGTQVSVVKNDVDSVSSKVDAWGATISTQDIIIKSDVDSVSTKVDTVNSQIVSCCETLSTAIAALGTTSIDVSFFGDTISAERDDHIAEQFQYGIPSLRVTSANSGTGSVSTSNSMAVVATGATIASSASIQSKRYIRYQPGRQGYGIFSARFSTPVSGTTQWMGLFDSSDGFAVGYNGTTFSILYRNSVTGSTVNTTVAQTSFNGDPLDGSGTSGITLDPTKLNIFRISYSWLGAAPITFDVMDSTGAFVTFHTIVQNNISANPSLLLPQLPMRAEVANAGAASNVSIFTAGWSGGIVGATRTPANSRLFTVSNTVASVTTTETHMLTIQNPTTFGGQTNKIEAKICIFGGGATSTSSQSNFMRLLRNATVTSTSFSAVSSGNSIMNVSTAGTYSAGTGTLLLSNPSTTSGNGPLVNYFDTRNNVIDIVILPGETITITAQGASATASSVIAILGWDERF